MADLVEVERVLQRIADDLQARIAEFVRGGDGSDVALLALHRQAQDLFNEMDQVAIGAKALRADPDDADTIAASLTSLAVSMVGYYAALRTRAGLVGLDYTSLTPTALAFRNSQRWIATYLPGQADELRAKHAELGLPTSGFDKGPFLNGAGVSVAPPEGPSARSVLRRLLMELMATPDGLMTFFTDYSDYAPLLDDVDFGDAKSVVFRDAVAQLYAHGLVVPSLFERLESARSNQAPRIRADRRRVLG